MLNLIFFFCGLITGRIFSIYIYITHPITAKIDPILIVPVVSKGASISGLLVVQGAGQNSVIC